MKKLLTTLLLAFGIFASTQATLIHLGDTLGQPSDLVSETARLEALISSYNLNLSGVTPLLSPTALGITGVQRPIENGLSSFTMDLTGYDGYLLLKWGNMDDFWSVRDVTGLHTFYSDNYGFSSDLGDVVVRSSSPRGLSHYTTFTTVPDTGSWFMSLAILLPFGLSVFGPKRLARVG